MRNFKNILITGGAGFIGSNFIRFLFKKTNFNGKVINYDKLTYAGNLDNLDEISREYKNQYYFEEGDICDFSKLKSTIEKYSVDCVIHFAAESHVDRSILGPGEFIQTNIIGTFTILEALRSLWAGRTNVHFHHVSTDEVYGSLGETGYFTEQTAYDPRSPYSASKASSDHLVSAYFHTYNIPITKSNCSNNYGPYHFPEKLIPLMISKLQMGESLPVYGDGKNIRDWLYVEDHAEAIWKIVLEGRIGETYNVGGENEWENIKLVKFLITLVLSELKKPEIDPDSLIKYVKDRPGHDRRYAIDCSKIKKELGWKPKTSFEEGLRLTVKWYLENPQWVERVTSGNYRNWLKENYIDR